MNNRRISVNVQQQILILRDKNFGIRRTAKVLKIARNTVRDFLRDCDADKNSESTSTLESKNKSSEFKINWEQVHLNFNKGILIKTQ